MYGMALNEALEILRGEGYSVKTNPGVYIVDGMVHVTIDGELRSSQEILAMVTPEDQDIWSFEARGNSYKVHVYFVYGGVDCEIYAGGKLLGSRQPIHEHPQDFVTRLAKEMGGDATLRRTFSGYARRCA